MKTKTIRQSVIFHTTAEKLYALLLDSKKLSRIHGSPAKMTRRSGGSFTVFGGYCHGYNVALMDNVRIEQAWHFQEEGWPTDYFSTCVFELGPVTNGTKLVFTHKGVPEHSYEAIKAGWKTYYWEPVQAYLAGKR